MKPLFAILNPSGEFIYNPLHTSLLLLRFVGNNYRHTYKTLKNDIKSKNPW